MRNFKVVRVLLATTLVGMAGQALAQGVVMPAPAIQQPAPVIPVIPVIPSVPASAAPLPGSALPQQLPPQPIGQPPAAPAAAAMPSQAAGPEKPPVTASSPPLVGPSVEVKGETGGKSAGAGKAVDGAAKSAVIAPVHVRKRVHVVRSRAPVRIWPGPTIAYEVQPWTDGYRSAGTWCFTVDREFAGLAQWKRCPLRRD